MRIIRNSGAERLLDVIGPRQTKLNEFFCFNERAVLGG